MSATASTRAVQQRTVDVRRRILDAAVAVLVSDGYAGATTLRIQQEADVSRGRLLHHFPSRDALLIAAVHHLAVERVQETATRTDWPRGAAARLDAAIDTMASTYEQPYFWASIELWIAARTHADLQRELRAVEPEVGRLVRESAAVFFGPRLAAHPRYPQVRDMLIVGLRGIAMTTSFDQRPQAVASMVDKLRAIAHTVLLAPEG